MDFPPFFLICDSTCIVLVMNLSVEMFFFFFLYFSSSTFEQIEMNLNGLLGVQDRVDAVETLREDKCFKHYSVIFS